MKLNDSFEGYLKYQEERGMNPKTITEDRRFLFGSLSHSIADRDIESLRLTDAAAVAAAGKAHGEFGSQRSVVVLRKFLRYLKETGHVLSFDWRDISIPKVPAKANEYFTEEEFELVMNSFDINTLPGLRTRALCEVLYATGMRISEAISLDKADIDWINREALITNVKTKDRGEKVYFTDRSLHWLHTYISARKDNLPHLFVTGRGRMLSVSARNYLRTHTDKLGIKKHIKHHIFRKTFVTHLIQKGADITAVRYLSRHKSPRTTLEYYAVLDKEKAKGVHERIMNNREPKQW